MLDAWFKDRKFNRMETCTTFLLDQTVEFKIGIIYIIRIFSVSLKKKQGTQ